MQDSDPIFQYNLFTTPSYDHHSPIEPLPMWLIDTISEKASSFHQAMELACETSDWGLVAKLTHYHESDTHVLNITAEMHALDCKLNVIKAASRQSCARLKGACAHHHL